MKPAPRSSLTDEVLSVVWFESRSLRAGLHRALRVDRCDTAVVGTGVRFGRRDAGAATGPVLRVDGGCPCRDQLLDLLVEADRFLRERGGRLRNPAGAVRTHLRTRGAGDWIRAARVARGAQARTDRIRSSARAGRLPDELHRAVLEYLVDEAGSPAPLAGDRQLTERLCRRAAAEFGGTPEQHRVAVLAALPVVEAVCRDGRRSVVDGVELTWWERYIDIPLGRRDGVGGALEPVADGVGEGAQPPCPVAESSLASVLDVVDHGPGGTDGAVLAHVLVAAASDAPEQAVVRTLAELVRREVVPPSVAACTADPAWVAAILTAARAALPAQADGPPSSRAEVDETGPRERVGPRDRLTARPRSVRPGRRARRG